MPRSPLYSDGGQAIPLMGEGVTESGLNALAKTMSLVGQMTALRNSVEDQAKQNQMFTVQYDSALRANRMAAEAEAQQNALVALAKTESAMLTGAADTPTTGEIKAYKDRGEQFLKKGPQYLMAAMLEFNDGATLLADQNGSKAALAFETASRHNPKAWPAGHINTIIADQFNQSNPALAMQALGENVEVDIPTLAGPNGPVRQKIGQVWETIFNPATSPEQVASRVALADVETRKKIISRLDTIEEGRGQAVLAALDKMKPVEQRSAEVQAIYNDAVIGSPAQKLAAYQKLTRVDPQYLTADQFGVLSSARKRLEDTQITLAADNDGTPPKTVSLPELAKLVVSDMAKQITMPEYGGQSNLAPYREPFAEIMRDELKSDKPGDVSRLHGWLAGFDADQEKRDTAIRSAHIEEMVGTIARSGVTTVVDKNGVQSVIPVLTDKDQVYSDLMDMAKNLGRNPYDLGTQYILEKEAAAKKISQLAGKEQVGTDTSASLVTVQKAAVLGQLWDKIASADKLRRTLGPQAQSTTSAKGTTGIKTDVNGLPVITDKGNSSGSTEASSEPDTLLTWYQAGTPEVKSQVLAQAVSQYEASKSDFGSEKATDALMVMYKNALDTKNPEQADVFHRMITARAKSMGEISTTEANAWDAAKKFTTVKRAGAVAVGGTVVLTGGLAAPVYAAVGASTAPIVGTATMIAGDIGLGVAASKALQTAGLTKDDVNWMYGGMGLAGVPQLGKTLIPKALTGTWKFIGRVAANLKTPGQATGATLQETWNAANAARRLSAAEVEATNILSSSGMKPEVIKNALTTLASEGKMNTWIQRRAFIKSLGKLSTEAQDALEGFAVAVRIK